MIYESVLAGNPAHVDALHALGVIAIQSGQYSTAVELIDKAIALQPDFAEAWNNRGQALKNLKRFDEALASYERAVALQPEFADAFSNRGVTLDILKRHEEALASYERAIELKPGYAGAYINRGLALKKLGCRNEALASYERAIALKPDSAEAWNNRGIVLGGLKRVGEALASYERAVALKPDYADAYYNRGNALNDLKRFEEALACFERAIALKPDHAEAWNNRGNTLQNLKRFDEALASFERAIELKPDHAEAYSNRGIALLNLKRIDEALGSFEGVIALKPNDPDAYINCGNALQNLNRFDEALASYERAIALKPDFAEAWNNRGNALRHLKRLDESLASYEHAMILKPDYELLLDHITHLRMQLGDWSALDQHLKALCEGIAAGENVAHSFPLLALIDDPALHRQAAEIFVRNKLVASSRVPTLPRPALAARTHIAYLSADFHDHATAFLMAELFEGHDRNRFELTAISFGPDKNDKMRQRVSAAFDRFIDARAMSDAEVARRCRELGVHIAIDLKGYTQDSRPGILAERCAPIQINYLGYPGTMAAPFIDYIVADRTLITEADLGDYSEKVIWLPDSYQVNDRQRPIADKAFTRAECGLPETGFVYCCFNNNYKITPATFDGWMRILARVPDSVLWLFEGNPWVVTNLRKEASIRGISPERLIFAKRMPLPEHLARHRLADLFIDTLPYNAHTTGSDALWAGLPLLTCMGRSFAARVAASLLKAVGLPELITTTQEDFENLAVALANDPERLGALRTLLQDNRLTHPLFDSRRFTRNIERAFEQVMERHWAGLEPEHMAIDECGDGQPEPARLSRPSRDPSEKKIFVFTISTGRSGTNYLTELFRLNTKDSEVHHEQLSYRDWGINSPDLSHLTAFNNIGNCELVRSFWANKFARLKAAENQYFVETSHVLAKAGLVENLDYLCGSGTTHLIFLKRDIVKTVVSFINRGDFMNKGNMWLWYLDPKYKNVIVPPDPFMQFGRIGVAFWYVVEMRVRAEYYRILTGHQSNVRFHEVDLEFVTEQKGAAKLLSDIGGVAVDPNAVRMPGVVNANRDPGESDELIRRVGQIVRRFSFNAPELARQYYDNGFRL